MIRNISIMGILITIHLMISCSTQLNQSVDNDSNTQTMSFADRLWIEFMHAMENKDVDFLVEHSLDSIQCSDCVSRYQYPDEYFPSDLIFQEYIHNLMRLDNLNQYNYVATDLDSMMYINYTITDERVPEGGYNIVFQFVKPDHRYLFSGTYTVP